MSAEPIEDPITDPPVEAPDEVATPLIDFLDSAAPAAELTEAEAAALFTFPEPSPEAPAEPGAAEVEAPNLDEPEVTAVNEEQTPAEDTESADEPEAVEAAAEAATLEPEAPPVEVAAEAPSVEAIPVIEKPPVSVTIAAPAIIAAEPIASAVVLQPPLPPVVQPRSRRALIVTTICLALLTAVAGGTYGVYASWRSHGRIASGMAVEDVSIANMTRDEARSALERRCADLGLTLTTPEHNYPVTLADLGGRPEIDRAVQDAYWYGRSGSFFNNLWKLAETHRNGKRVELAIAWDKQKLKATTRKLAAKYHLPPKNASLRVTGDAVLTVAERPGRELDVGGTLQRLQETYRIDQSSLQAVVKEVTPRITSADLQGADIKLGDYRTRFDSDLIGRTRNIHIASGIINGQVLMPGQTFSFNGLTGERTWEKGYRMAHIFERKPGKTEAEVVDGLAGGVCQVSSTLFNAVRRSNRTTKDSLKVVERSFHSLPVTYVPSGLDATVAWPNRDFKFRNSLSYPIYMRTQIKGEHLQVSIWARVPQKMAGAVLPTLTAAAASLKSGDAE